MKFKGSIRTKRQKRRGLTTILSARIPVVLMHVKIQRCLKIINRGKDKKEHWRRNDVVNEALETWCNRVLASEERRKAVD